jgi:hypothetical protein
MHLDAWRSLFVGLVGVSLFTGVGCSSKEQPETPGTGGSTTTGGSGGIGGAGGTPGGGAPTGGVGGTPGGGTGGVLAGAGGTPGAGFGGVAGTPGVGGAGFGGVAGTPASGGAGASGAGTSGDAGSAGAAAGSAGSAGDGGGAPATLVEPIERNGNYVLEFGDLYFEVSPLGARVMDLHLAGGTNLLRTGRATPPNMDDDNYGSTFWTAPQSVWSWPPPAEIDRSSYTATVAAPSITFVGTSNATIGASVTKKFTADLANGVINAEYTIIATAAGKSFAPWEITRFAQRGLTFWPTGSAPTGTSLPPTTTGAGCTWHESPSTPPGTDQKLFADGTGGWLAHVDGDTVVVKKFPDIMASEAAPEEAEIEVYVNGTSPYIEMEQQGAYQAVAMGASLTWTVTWIVRKLPSGLTPTAGSQELVNFVQSLIQ